MMGDDELVQAEKTAFHQFLKSVSFPEADEQLAETEVRRPRPVSTNVKEVPHTAAASSGKPTWDVPAGWQEQAAPPMVLSSFLISGADGGKATVTVSMLPGNAGGPLANVNRWRGQLGLAPVEEAELAKLASPLDVLGGKAMLVEMSGADVMTGRKAHLVAAMVPRDGSTWFYKLMGDEPVVAGEKAEFIKFVQTVRYPANG